MTDAKIGEITGMAGGIGEIEAFVKLQPIGCSRYHQPACRGKAAIAFKPEGSRLLVNIHIAARDGRHTLAIVEPLRGNVMNLIAPGMVHLEGLGVGNADFVQTGRQRATFDHAGDRQIAHIRQNLNIAGSRLDFDFSAKFQWHVGHPVAKPTKRANSDLVAQNRLNYTVRHPHKMYANKYTAAHIFGDFRPAVL